MTEHYLLWPPCVALFGRHRAPWLAALAIVLSPASRVATYYLVPALRTDLGYMTHTRFDALMVGCLAATLCGKPWFHRAVRASFAAQLPLMAIPFLLYVSPFLQHRIGGAYQLLVGFTLEAIAIMLILFWVVERPWTWVGRALNNRLVVHIGTISYSLYIWQQLFTFKPAWWSVFAMVLAAECSYWFIERPFLKLRHLASPTKHTMTDAPSSFAPIKHVP